LFLFALSFSDAYKILVYNSKYGHSHSYFMGRIADILAEAGHEVTSLVPILDETVPDGTTKSKVIHVQQDPRAVEEAKATRQDMDFYSMDSFSILAQLFVGRYLGKVFSYTCEKTLDEPGLIDKLRAETFDVMISEHFDMCGLGISHLIKPRAYIGASATEIMNHEYEEFGVPRSLSYNPGSYMTHLNVHSMWSRIKNIYAEFLINIFFHDTRTKVEAVFKNKFGKEFPDFVKLSSHSAYVFTNSEPLIDFAVPTLTRVIPIGGLNAKDPKPLDEKWSGILSSRPRAVLISFGSVVQSYMLPIEVKRNMLKTISSFPEITFIWKYEKDDEFAKGEAAKVKNLHLAKWQPQVDILNHPNLAVFITHGGMGSTQETAMRGVPGVFIPFFGDQPRNAGMMHHNELGIAIEKGELGDAVKLTAVLRELLENEKYRKNAKRIAAMLSKKPFSSKQQLVKYTEFAAEFGPSSALRPQSHDMSSIAYHNIDVVLFLVLISFGLALLLLYILLKKIFGKKGEKAKSAPQDSSSPDAISPLLPAKNN
ncbi:hypothetical protein PMAYCL1PPCAC_07585, partial [Pristionchus mayeri]